MFFFLSIVYGMGFATKCALKKRDEHETNSKQVVFHIDIWHTKILIDDKQYRNNSIVHWKNRMKLTWRLSYGIGIFPICLLIEKKRKKIHLFSEESILNSNLITRALMIIAYSQYGISEIGIISICMKYVWINYSRTNESFKLTSVTESTTNKLHFKVWIFN